MPGLQGTTRTTGTFTGAPGFEYCFSVRARDHAGNVSSFGKAKCMALPVDDPALKASGGWTRKQGSSGDYLRTVSVSSRNGATLSLGGVFAKQIAVLVRLCPGCGTIQAFQGTRSLGFADLRNSTTVKRFLITGPTLSSVKHGTVKVKVVTSGKPVWIDGLAVRRA